MPATNAFLGVLARAASIVSGLALVSPSSLALLGGGGGGGSGLPGGASAGLRGAVLSRARGRAEAAASARRGGAGGGGPRSSVADTTGPQAVDQEAVALLTSPPLTFSFRLGVALGSGSGVTGGSLGRETSRLPSTPHLEDSNTPRDAAAVDAESSWWLAAMRHGYHVASAASRGGGRRGSDGDSAAAASQASQHAWPAIPFSEPPVPGLASSVTAVDAEGRSVASLPLPSSFGASLQQPSLSSVIELHLPDCGLTRLDGIGLTECTALRVLDVSFNTLTSLQVRRLPPAAPPPGDSPAVAHASCRVWGRARSCCGSTRRTMRSGAWLARSRPRRGRRTPSGLSRRQRLAAAAAAAATSRACCRRRSWAARCCSTSTSRATQWRSSTRSSLRRPSAPASFRWT